MHVCSNSHPHTLTLLVTVDPTEALRTAAVVVCLKVLEMRRQGMLLVHTVTHGATMLHGCWYTSTRLLITHCASPSIHAGVRVALICLPLTVDSLKPCCTQTLILIRSSIVACCTILTRSGVSTVVKICSSIVTIMLVGCIGRYNIPTVQSLLIQYAIAWYPGHLVFLCNGLGT